MARENKNKLNLIMQNYIALAFVFIAVAYTFYSVVKLFTKNKKETCGSGCSCGAKNEINNLILKNSPLSIRKKTFGNNFELTNKKI